MSERIAPTPRRCPVPCPGRAVLLALLLVAAPLCAHQAPPERTMTAVRIRGDAPRIDGRLDDSVWKRTPVHTGFVQREPEEGKPASERTEVRFAYDDEALYVAIMAHDREPSAIVSRLVRRDQWTECDNVQVMLDTHHDHQTACWFEVKAGGSVTDGRIAADDDWDDTWNGVWESAQAVGLEGWSVELRIPYHVLRFSPAPAYSWGVNVVRRISRRKEVDYWVMVPRQENGFVSRFAHLEGIESISPRRSLEVLPYGAARSTWEAADGRGAAGSVGAGADVRYGLSSSLSLNAAISPDFGQVEADPAELSLSVFETWQQERRPFFVEGGQYFDTPIDLFYSRRIGRSPGYLGVPDGYEVTGEPDHTTILGAVKLTGKTARKTSFGLIGALTAAERARIDSACIDPATGAAGHAYHSFLREPRSGYFVGRLKQDLLRGNSHVGLLGTAVARDGAADAWSGGADWNLRWADNGYSFRGMVAGTETGEPGDRHRGYGNVTVLSKTSGWLLGDLWWEAFSPGYDPNDLGFLWRNDYYNAWFWVQVRRQEPWGPFRSNYLNFNRWGMWNFDEVTLEDGYNFNMHHELASYWWLNAELWHMRRARDDLDTRGGPLIVAPARSGGELSLESDEGRTVSGWLEIEYEHDAAGGSRRELGAGVTLRPHARLEVQVRPRYERETDDAQWLENYDTDGDGEDDEFVYAELRSRTLDLTTRLNVLFSPDLSLELYLQPFVTVGDYGATRALAAPSSYSFAPHPGPGDDPDFRYRSLRGNAVLRWEYRPGSTLYLVWSQAREQEGHRPRFRPLSDALGSFRDDGTSILLLKVSCWLHP